MLIEHHQKATAATMAAAKAAGMNPSPPMPDPGATASINELGEASAADFDRLYIGSQISAQQAALDLQQSYASGGDQRALKAPAKKAMPIVESHLAAAEELRRVMMGDQNM